MPGDDTTGLADRAIVPAKVARGGLVSVNFG